MPGKVYLCLYRSQPKAALFKGIHVNKQVVLQIWKIFQVKFLTNYPLPLHLLCHWHLGLCLLSPSLCSVWTEEAQCTLLNATITETFNCSFSCGPDCWKLSQYPCLQVYVNLTSSGEKLLLYHTEETMKINQKVGAWHTLHLIHPKQLHSSSSLSL